LITSMEAGSPMISMDEILRRILSFSRGLAEKEIEEFIREKIEEAGSRYGIVGISGGIDSSTTLALATRALGKDRVIAVIMPHEGITPEEDVEDALSLVRSLGVKHMLVRVSPACERIKYELKGQGLILDHKAYGNIIARVRMTTLYAIANSVGGLVIGTGDKSELLIGYFTKYGDGGVDILPLGDLYKTQVRALGKYLGLPSRIYEKPSSPRLWPGQTAEGELRMSYREIDTVLYALFELGMKPDEVKQIKGIEPSTVDRVMELMRRSEHKRRTPPIAVLSDRAKGLM